MTSWLAQQCIWAKEMQHKKDAKGTRTCKSWQQLILTICGPCLPDNLIPAKSLCPQPTRHRGCWQKLTCKLPPYKYHTLSIYIVQNCGWLQMSIFLCILMKNQWRKSNTGLHQTKVTAYSWRYGFTLCHAPKIWRLDAIHTPDINPRLLLDNICIYIQYIYCIFLLLIVTAF